MTVTESGTLAERPLGSLPRDLADRGSTGIVHIDGSVHRIVCLSDGRLYLALPSPGVSPQRALTDAGGPTPDHGSIVDALLEQAVVETVEPEPVQAGPWPCPNAVA